MGFGTLKIINNTSAIHYVSVSKHRVFDNGDPIYIGQSGHESWTRWTGPSNTFTVSLYWAKVVWSVPQSYEPGSLICTFEKYLTDDQELYIADLR